MKIEKNFFHIFLPICSRWRKNGKCPHLGWKSFFAARCSLEFLLFSPYNAMWPKSLCNTFFSRCGEKTCGNLLLEKCKQNIFWVKARCEWEQMAKLWVNRENILIRKCSGNASWSARGLFPRESCSLLSFWWHSDFSESSFKIDFCSESFRKYIFLLSILVSL